MKAKTPTRRASVPALPSKAVPQLLGVTVSTPKYAALAREAVRRVEKHLQIPVLVLECADAEAFTTKMRLDLLCPSTRIVFFDADWWALKRIDLSGWGGDAVMAVHDAGVFHPGAFCMPDSATLGLERSMYVNTGLLMWDNGNELHRRLFRTARSIEHDIFRGVHPALDDFGEQSLLNAGIQRNHVPLHLLPFGYNTMLHFVRGGVFPYVPRNVLAVHAAGVPVKRKVRHLRAAVELFSAAVEPMQPEAMAFHHSLQFETR